MKILKSKVFLSLIIIFCLGLILGIVSFYLVNELDKININENLINYFTNIDDDNISYSNGIFYSIVSNVKVISLIWLCGLIFILVFIIPFIIIFRGILFTFTIFNIISVFSLKGFIYALILLFPVAIINILLLFISYYSINFSIKCYKAFKYNKNINLKDFIKNYFIIYLIFLFISITISFIEVYFISNILKFVV